MSYINMKDPDFSQRLAELNAAIEASPNEASLYIKRGMLYWQADERGAALTDYNHALALDPEGPARQLLEHSNEILDFYNHDLYNP